jgi:assimilatory nitrate reductase catalytic subunit
LRVFQSANGASLVTATPDYPVNYGAACPKGWEAVRVLNAADRATEPLLRTASGQFRPVSWAEALREFVTRVRAIQRRYGPASMAFLGTGQLTTEELAFLGSLTKFGMGMLHGDGNTRQCMASAVVAYKEAFGFDAPPYTYADLELSDLLVFVGANPCIAHPILWQRVANRTKQAKIVVIDPRLTETAAQATLHVPIRPKTDIILFYGLARLLIEHGWIDREYIEQHTTNFDAFARFVQPFVEERVCEQTGVSADVLHTLAQWIHEAAAASFWWTMGVNQSHQGVRTAQAIINVALMTGNLGRPGTGANSITGQCNAMGSRLFSNTTNLLGGHDFGNPEHRAKVARVLQIPPSCIPQQPSWHYHRILEEIIRGNIRGLWVVCTNPAHSWINQRLCHEVLSRLELLVVQDMYRTTETAQCAHLLLPAAGWGEKTGTFINSERRIGLVRPVATPPGAALADFVIFQRVAEAWGCADMFRHWKTPEDVFRVLQQLTAGQPCDITGIRGYEHLESVGGIQWPYPEGCQDERNHRRLFEDGTFYHSDGRARFCFEEPSRLPEPTDEHYPFLLNSGRGSASQWHTQTRTAKSPILRKLAPQRLIVEIHPQDAKRLGIQSYDLVEIASRRASIHGVAFITSTVPPGTVFLPMHYPEVNRLTPSVFDPYSHQPAYKACAVRVRPVSSTM